MISHTNTVRHIFSPAKINLYLHVTGRRDDGYHELDSMVVFADIGDDITIEPADSFSFHINGPFSDSFDAKAKDASPHSSNLVVRAVWELSRTLKKNTNFKITLTKNLPIASGIGGGSSNAAAMLWGLLDYWKVSNYPDGLEQLMLELGADVPACFHCAPCRMTGIGEILEPAPEMTEIPVLLINPNEPCPTEKVFKRFTKFNKADFKTPMELPGHLDHYDDLTLFLKNKSNDLTQSAIELCPTVIDVLDILNTQSGCEFAQLSGSGATCFGLFEHYDHAKIAARSIVESHPDWWVKYGHINRPQRY
jgi:4-diphosphocytidyl-2-C-methyl-D-erythritol kinase